GVSGEQRAGELFGSVRSRVDDVAVAAAGNDGVERRHLRRVVEELRRLKKVPPAGTAGGVVVNHHADHAIDVTVHRIRIQQDVLNNAEDRRGRADAERERQYGGGGETGLLQQAPCAISRVLEDAAGKLAQDGAD